MYISLKRTSTGRIEKSSEHCAKRERERDEKRRAFDRKVCRFIFQLFLTFAFVGKNHAHIYKI